MAGIAGIYCADGQLADLTELKRMTATVEHRGPDGVAFWSSGPVAFAHLQFCTTHESLDEKQPLLAPSAEACLVWDGRLDNRAEISDALAAQGATPVDCTDPGLVLASYLLWGTDCARRLVGDFAFAVWDARLHRLWCARDLVGVRPFYYFWDGRTFLFGPEVRALLAHPLVSTKINEGMAGEYILDEITTRDETLYSDIRKLPSNSTLTIDSSGSLRVASWWDPDLSLLDYRTDEEYAEHFRRLLDQSILSQTRCNTPWGIELSGGLDSSSIAVSARAARGSREADPILTFSMACPGKRWDESDDIAAVVRQADLTAEFVQPLKVDLEFFRRRAAYSRDFPGNPNGEPMTIPMYEAARRRGARVLLTGVGGDEWLDGSPSHIVDLAARLGRPGTARQLIKRSKIDWRYYDRPHKHWSIFLLRRILSRVAPDWVHLRRTKLRLLRHSVFSEEFLGRTCLADRLAAPPEKENRPFATRAQRDAFRVAVSGAETYVFELNDREAALAGVEVRNPLFDRRLAEFCLRIPEDQRQQGTARKRMLRNAMHNRLPERVRAKTAKAEFSELFDAVCRTPQAAERLQNLSIRRHTGWFDPHRLERHIAELNQPASPDCPRPWARWMLLGTDLWFEHVLSSRVTFR